MFIFARSILGQGICLLSVITLASSYSLPLTAQEGTPQDDAFAEVLGLAWQHGPTIGNIDAIATIAVPPQYKFLDASNTSRFLVLNDNPPEQNSFTIAPESLNWFAIFTFDASGFVKDDEEIKSDALLEDIKAADEPSNEERKKLGMSTLTTLGWFLAPHYDIDTNRLEWGLKLQTQDGQILVNYTTRFLGRRGVMAAVLVSDPEHLTDDVSEFKRLLTGFDYRSGERYAEFRSGDKIAEYGIGALVLGGAAAVAAKTGFLKVLAKFAWVIVLAVAAAVLAGLKTLKTLFTRRKPEK